MTKRNKVAAQGKKHKVNHTQCQDFFYICYLSNFLFPLPLTQGRCSRWQTEEGKYGRQEEII